LFTQAGAETETIDLKALAKKARPVVMLLKLKGKAGSDETQPIRPAANLPFLPPGNQLAACRVES
jgi:hypothetical protein